MYRIKNRINAPFQVHLKSGSLHLAANGFADVSKDDWDSPDLQLRIKKNQIADVTVKQVKGETKEKK